MNVWSDKIFDHYLRLLFSDFHHLVKQFQRSQIENQFFCFGFSSNDFQSFDLFSNDFLSFALFSDNFQSFALFSNDFQSFALFSDDFQSFALFSNNLLRTMPGKIFDYSLLLFANVPSVLFSNILSLDLNYSFSQLIPEFIHLLLLSISQI